MHCVLLLFFVAFGANTLHPPADTPRVVNITITPVVTHSIISGLLGEYILHYITKANKTLVDIPLTLASSTTAGYNTSTLTAKDHKGKLKLLTSEGTNTNSQPTRYFRTTRATKGPVTVQFTTEPVTNFPTRVGPLFDLRQQVEYKFSLRWDLKHAPQGTTTAWTWGKGSGPFYHSSTRDNILYTYFAVGRLNRYPKPSASTTTSAPPKSEFGIYWIEDPPFNTTKLGTFINKFFNISTTFWQDETNQLYHIFIRRNTKYGGGGMALTRSFMFGWNPANATDQESLRLLISHKITHNWAQMPGASALILYRLALYYGNSYVNATDTEAYENAWGARDAQRIPYGRGLIELANLDAAMRNQSLTLDNLTHDMRQLCISSASACTPASWVNVTADNLGPSAVAEYNRVTSGKPLLVPIAGSLGPCFEVVRTKTHPETWAWQAKSSINISSKACII
ncbi:hypothetical protein BJX63DRAFT_420787 [Aspergillus granulosus]|uniref:Uncharacterized protein n=1 Tax=Aspergillus granulosus TaxID=176169 RepID=A0ABR4HGA7_9EURO